MIAMLFLNLSDLRSQSIENKLSFGLRLGPNLWLNDLNNRQVGFGIEGFGRWGISGSAAIGATLGFESLKSGQRPRTTEINIDYLSITALHGSLNTWVFLSSSEKFTPYFYAGIGGVSYRRSLGDGIAFPSDESGFSISIPLGIGFEVVTGRSFSFQIDFGYRILDSKTDNFPTGSDSYPTVKAGLAYTMGSNDEDDDDADGLANGRERDLGTDPEDPDTDKDGLKDGEEIRTMRTNPLKADTDEDGISDGDEFWKVGTDPLKTDSDDDGLSDGDELNKHETDPLKRDSDTDGLSDGEEVLGHHTNPLEVDTDGDGISDSSELFAYKTNPTKPDTDGGGTDDGTEIKRVTNPLNPADDLPARKTGAAPKTETVTAETDSSEIKIGKRYVIEGLTFESWKSDISPNVEDALEKLLQILSLNPEIEIEIQGHTDASGGGGRGRSIALSRSRARAVKTWLVDRGIASKRMTVKGVGPDEPIVSDDTEEGKAKNRRIEYIRVK